MRILFNQDQNHVDKVKLSIKENDGYCPCKLVKTEDTKCMCKEFRDTFKDDSFEGYCHCGLYLKLN